MITRNEAARLTQKELEGSDSILFEEPIADGTYGWVFAYQSAKYLETGNSLDMLAGNAPFLVERETGMLHVLGTAELVEHYIENFLSSGDPHRR
ncbi:MAG: YrhB domain-containing protein [Albidovulum sp.]